MYKQRAVIAKAVTDLICLIVDEIDDDGTINPPIKEIHIIEDGQWHWCVSAMLEGDYPYQYAIYINKETGATETDAF